MTAQQKIESLINRSQNEIEMLKRDRFFCPACKAPVIIKNGQLKRPHFAHNKVSDCINSSEGETEEHLILKEIFVKWCIKEKITFEVEPYLAELKQRPDVLIENLAIEIQCSPLSYKRMQERTQSYLHYGYIPIWILGTKLAPKKKFTESTKKFCYFSDRLGFYIWLIDWQKKEVILLYHIEEDWSGVMYFASKKWSFYTNGLLEMLFYPTNAQIYNRRSYDMKRCMESYYYNLKEKLVRRNEELRKVQTFFYLQYHHILYLPYWFYYPGIRIFELKGTDLILKQKIWSVLQRDSKNRFSLKQLMNYFYNEIRQTTHYFYDFPNIKKSELEWSYSNQLLTQWIECGLLIKKNECFQINENCMKNKKGSLKRFLIENKNKSVNTATPLKNMIR